MTMLITPRTSQPQGAVGIDWSNPITSRLQSLLNPARSLVDIVDGGTWTPWGTTPSAGVGPRGRAVDSLAAFGGLRLDTRVNIALGDQTHIIVCDFASVSGNYAGLLTAADTSGTITSLSLQNAVSAMFNIWPANSGEVATTLPTGAPFGPSVIVLVGSAAGCIAYKNGVQIGSNGSGPTSRSNTRIVLHGERTASATYASKARTYLYGGWNRRLSVAEIKSLSDNPWQIFAPIRTPIFVPIVPVVSIYRPSSDVTTTGWTGNPDNTTLYTNIDEVTASDTDYITSPTITGGESIIFGLSGSLAAGTWDVRYRANYVSASSQVKIHLLDGSNVSQGASGWQTVTGSYADYTASVTTTGTATRVKIEVQ